jgi:hypothetical protein
MIALLLLRDLIGLQPSGEAATGGCKPPPGSAEIRPSQHDPNAHERALQKRSDNNGCAARLSPQTLLFATQSLARLYSIADDSQENACRLHPSATASPGRWACHQRNGPLPNDKRTGIDSAAVSPHAVQRATRLNVKPLPPASDPLAKGRDHNGKVSARQG